MMKESWLDTFTSEDIVKLVSVRTRQYAGEYVARGGAASLLVKYIF